MKLFNLCLIATVFGQGPNDERKIPPRTPEQRLTFLNIKLQDWIVFNFLDKRPDRTIALGENIATLVTDKIERAFLERKCATWSKEWLPHGGPDPNGPMATIPWKDYRKTLITKLDARVAAKVQKGDDEENSRKRRDVNIRARRTLEMMESIDDDVFDNFFIQAAKDGERSAGLELERMLSTDQRIRLYQILVSYLKWAYRYLSNCPNDAADDHAVRVYDYVQHTLVDLYDRIQARLDG